jgi:hypothetical protein
LLKLLEDKVATLFDAISHGDEDHQAWLKEAIRCHFDGRRMPEYVAGKSKKDAAIAELQEQLRQTEWKFTQTGHPDTERAAQYVKRPIEMKLLGWRIDWPDPRIGVGALRWCGADDWKTKDRMVKLGGVAVDLWGDPAKAPSSGPDMWPVIGKEYAHRPDEPFFVLLGRDPQAPALIESWAQVRELAEPGDWKIEAARQTAKDMRFFKVANPDFGMSQDLYETTLKNYLGCTDSVPNRRTVDLPGSIHPLAAQVLASLVPVGQQSFTTKAISPTHCELCRQSYANCRCELAGS